MPVDDSYTKSLLHFNGTDGSTTFTDESGKTWTANGNAQIDTAQSKFGGASGLFDGTGDYISTPDHADFVLGSGDWTFDFWIRWNSTGGAGTYPNLIAQRADGNNYFTIFRSVDTNRLTVTQIDGGVTRWNFRANWTPSTGTWYHLAFVRNGATPLIFVDGTSLTVTEDTAISGKTAANIAASVTIGEWNGTAVLNGWIDELRFSNGIARWTANFTPPTSAYASASGGSNFFPFF